MRARWMLAVLLTLGSGACAWGTCAEDVLFAGVGGKASDPSSAFGALPAEFAELTVPFFRTRDPLVLRVFEDGAEAEGALAAVQRRMPGLVANQWSPLGLVACPLLALGCALLPSPLIYQSPEASMVGLVLSLFGGLGLAVEFLGNGTPPQENGQVRSRGAIAAEIAEHRAIWQGRSPGARLTHFRVRSEHKPIYLLTYLGTDSRSRTVLGVYRE